MLAIAVVPSSVGHAWIALYTPFLQAAFEVVVGGLIVFAAGILIGSA